jgi:uncharacterized membrane protein YoaK (UPF0700 family)
MKIQLPTLLSFNGGYVDTAGFLALQGLFTAHVTGNFVTLGASMALGLSGAVAKLLALPVFCVVIVLARLLGQGLSRRGLPVVRILLALKLALFVVAAALAIRFGPFANGDGWQPILTGMTLVSAMAIQNALHRVHFPSAPPSTLMTGTTTQVMIDVADLLSLKDGQKRSELTVRIRRMTSALGSFVAGCACAALLFMAAKMACFVVPPLLVVVGMISAEGAETPHAQPAK